ncbi:MAG TPA: hypothetical protein PKH43_13185, partial [Saprospiraceae bacterium]|nr:hypothetical protein [Saprospiraceae bacterium]
MAKRTLISEEEALKTTTRQAQEGDVIGGDTPVEARAKTVNRRIRAKLNKEATALEDILDRTDDDKKMTAEEYLKSFPLEEREWLLKVLLEDIHQAGLAKSKKTRDD